MFELIRSGDDGNRVRLIASDKLMKADFIAISEALDTPPLRARKVGHVGARRSRVKQRIETHWNGKETQNMAAPDDWIVTNLNVDLHAARDKDGHANTYVIRSDRFGDLYEATGRTGDFGDVYRATSQVEAIYIAGGFEIRAPWNEIQRAPSGYLILNGTEVYGNHEETFRASYEIVT